MLGKQGQVLGIDSRINTGKKHKVKKGQEEEKKDDYAKNLGMTCIILCVCACVSSFRICEKVPPFCAN
jgi:hypothetical protein